MLNLLVYMYINAMINAMTCKYFLRSLYLRISEDLAANHAKSVSSGAGLDSLEFT